ncbi:hypothetical protein SNEBB_007200 [Seison nebaliae]|nr:hypothetical protein SNEBB_007200 [Seison nebaliae]
MFRSQELFKEFPCPFYEHQLCNRLNCFYLHDHNKEKTKIDVLPNDKKKEVNSIAVQVNEDIVLPETCLKQIKKHLISNEKRLKFIHKRPQILNEIFFITNEIVVSNGHDIEKNKFLFNSLRQLKKTLSLFIPVTPRTTNSSTNSNHNNNSSTKLSVTNKPSVSSTRTSNSGICKITPQIITIKPTTTSTTSSLLSSAINFPRNGIKKKTFSQTINHKPVIPNNTSSPTPAKIPKYVDHQNSSLPKCANNLDSLNNKRIAHPIPDKNIRNELEKKLNMKPKFNFRDQINKQLSGRADFSANQVTFLENNIPQLTVAAYPDQTNKYVPCESNRSYSKGSIISNTKRISFFIINSCFSVIAEEKQIFLSNTTENGYKAQSVSTLMDSSIKLTSTMDTFPPQLKKEIRIVISRMKESDDTFLWVYNKLRSDYTMSVDELQRNHYPYFPSNEDSENGDVKIDDWPANYSSRNYLAAKSNEFGNSTQSSSSSSSSTFRSKNTKNCSRCGQTFTIYANLKYANPEKCLYHWGRLISTKIDRGNYEKIYSCCRISSTGNSIVAGCCEADSHVHDGYLEMGFCKDFKSTSSQFYNINDIDFKNVQITDRTLGKIYAIDCEMCYTAKGCELARVTVVDFTLNPVYDRLVKPSTPIIDYNTRWSGLSEDIFKENKDNILDIKQVQDDLINKLGISEDTILIGHSLDSDLRALKLVHYLVVDTSIVFPHKSGPPMKRSLKDIVENELMKTIQNNDDGHDSLEDANSCMELIFNKLALEHKSRWEK